ncbi:MAG: LPS export ABC transporter ATP-binding protein [bacterium]|nr:LPS export ABC transporter ATP-binding protein [bacterium]
MQLKVKDIYKSYNKKFVVKGVTLTVNQGEIVGLLGPNGAGKTTTFYSTVGMITPNSGDIFLDNIKLTNLPMYKRAQLGISYLSQEPSIFRKLTVEENVMAILEYLPISKKEKQARLYELLDDLGLTHLRKRTAFSLSGGEKRRVEICRALVNTPKFMLLDEPFVGVDPIAVDDIQKIIFELKSRGFGVLITDHNVRETLEVIDRAYVICEGKLLLEGTAEDLITSEEAKRVYLGEKFTL